MKIVIEFYRTRHEDDAHAIVGRETVEAADLSDAIERAQMLSQTLNMPQQPDAMTITNANGRTLYSGALDGGRPSMMEAIRMNVDKNRTERRPNAFAIGVWENEGGALGCGLVGRMFGRRIEANRSWTVYHVFTGVPAHVAGQPMVGLSREDATDGMTSLNLHDTGRRNERVDLSADAPNAYKCTVCQA